MLSLLKNSLENREQRIVLNGQTPVWRKVISTRVTFLIYINDLPDQINSFCKMFLGDTFLFSKVYDINTSVSKLKCNNNDISKCPLEKHIGIVFDSKLKFNAHLNQKIKCVTK